MSSKKIFTTVGIDETILKEIKTEAESEQRSMSAMVNKILLEYLKIKHKGGKQWPLNF